MTSVQDGRTTQTTRSSNENYTFDGNSVNFYSWVMKFEARQPRSANHIDFLRPLLVGNALEVYNRLDNCVKDDYERTRRALVDAYPPDSFEAYTEIMSRRRRPIEPITSYSEDLLKLIKRFVPNLEEASPDSFLVLFKSAFFAGLPEPIRRQYESPTISSMERMQDIIELLDSNRSIIGENTARTATTEESPHGERLNAQYALLGILGSGAYGTVYKAWNVSDRSWCAIKEVKVDKHALGFIEKEAEVHQDLKHEHVVKYITCFRDTIQHNSSPNNGPAGADRLSQAAVGSSLTSSRPMEGSDTGGSNSPVESGVRSTSEEPMEVADSSSSNPMARRQPPSGDIVSAQVLYIVMDLCDTSLKQYLRDNRQPIVVLDNKQPIADHSVVWTPIRQLLKALIYLKKRNIGHGDVHEGNVLLKLKQPPTGSRDLSAYDIKLSDFGRRSFSENTYPVRDQQDFDLRQVGLLALSLLAHPRDEKDDFRKRFLSQSEFPDVVEPAEQRIITMMTKTCATPADILAELDLVSPRTRPAQRVTDRL